MLTVALLIVIVPLCRFLLLSAVVTLYTVVSCGEGVNVSAVTLFNVSTVVMLDTVVSIEEEVNVATVVTLFAVVSFGEGVNGSTVVTLYIVV